MRRPGYASRSATQTTASSRRGSAASTAIRPNAARRPRASAKRAIVPGPPGRGFDDLLREPAEYERERQHCNRQRRPDRQARQRLSVGQRRQQEDTADEARWVALLSGAGAASSAGHVRPAGCQATTRPRRATHLATGSPSGWGAERRAAFASRRGWFKPTGRRRHGVPDRPRCAGRCPRI
jgi:hypothetical protein